MDFSSEKHTSIPRFLQAMSSLKRKEKQYKVEVKQHVKQTKCNSENAKKCNCDPMSEQKLTIILQHDAQKKYIQEISALLSQQRVKRTESRKNDTEVFSQ